MKYIAIKFLYFTKKQRQNIGTKWVHYENLILT